MNEGEGREREEEEAERAVKDERVASAQGLRHSSACLKQRDAGRHLHRSTRRDVPTKGLELEFETKTSLKPFRIGLSLNV